MPSLPGLVALRWPWRKRQAQGIRCAPSNPSHTLPVRWTQRRGNHLQESHWHCGRTITSLPSSGSRGRRAVADAQRTLWISIICTLSLVLLLPSIQVKINQFLKIQGVSNLLPDAENTNRASTASEKKDHFKKCDFSLSFYSRSLWIIGISISKMCIHVFQSMMKYWFSVHLETVQKQVPRELVSREHWIFTSRIKSAARGSIDLCRFPGLVFNLCAPWVNLTVPTSLAL